MLKSEVIRVRVISPMPPRKTSFATELSALSPRPRRSSLTRLCQDPGLFAATAAHSGSLTRLGPGLLAPATSPRPYSRRSSLTPMPEVPPASPELGWIGGFPLMGIWKHFAGAEGAGDGWAGAPLRWLSGPGRAPH